MEENEKINSTINSENNMNQQNSNPEVKSRNKNITIVLVSVIIVLLIAIGICVGLWFAGDTTKIINNKEEVIKEENSKTEENKTSKKIDETKPWVYDADYLAGRTDKKLEDYVVSKELKAPYININSEDAKKANEEIKNMFEKSYTDNFNDYTIGKISYEYVETKNILSVVIYEVNCLVRGGGRRNIYTYAFNLDNLKYATFKDMCLACNIDEDIVKGQVKELADKSIFKESFEIENNYYIDNNGELRCVLNNEYVESGMFVFIRVMSNSVNIVDEESYNELYGTNSDNGDNLDEGKNENKIIKHLAPAGWAGSSNHEIRLYSNGDVYHVVYSGEGIAEEYIVTKELIAKNATDMEEKRRGQGFEAIIIKGENVEVLMNLGEWIKFEKDIESEEQILCEDFSFMSGLKNTVYETTNKKEGERYFKISFDENSKPTIYIEDIGAQPYATYRTFYNVKSDVAAGSAYVEFSYRTLNETGDFQTGKIKYSNVTNNDCIYLTMPETSGKELELCKKSDIETEYKSQLYSKSIINEYGDCSMTTQVYGRQFTQINGQIGRANIYYIDDENNLCKISLVDLKKQILANYVKDIQIDQNNIIHAYPIGESFENNIVMEDEFVVFENIN